MNGEQTISQSGTGESMTEEQVKALVEARVKSALDIASSRAMAAPTGQETTRQEYAEPEGWWNIWALGPFQVPAVGGPRRPSKVIRVGENFFVATVLWLNPFLILQSGVSACENISNQSSHFELDYCTGDLCRWAAVPAFSPQNIRIDLRSNQCYYVDVRRFTAARGMESCIYEMNICARIVGCPPNSRTFLAGYASAVYNFDPDLFYPVAAPPPTLPVPTPIPPTPPGFPRGWRFDVPIRFQIYS